MDPLNRYLFGVERYVTCRKCSGAVHFIHITRIVPPIPRWSSCELCNPGLTSYRNWYLR